MYSSRIMRKPAFYIYENKGADQLCGNHAADQHLCFRYTDSTIPDYPFSSYNLKFQVSCHLMWLYSPVCVRYGWKPGRQFFSQRGSGAPIAWLGERRTLDRKVAGSSSPGARCCVLEQDTSSSLLSTGSTQENVPT